MKLDTVKNLQQTVFIENVNIILPYSDPIVTHIMVRIKLTYDYEAIFYKNG